MKRIAWTPGQDVELRTLFATLTSREVAIRMGLSVSAVENRIRRLGGRLSPARNEAPAFRSDPLLAERASKGSEAGGSEPAGSPKPSSAGSTPAPVAPAVHTSRTRTGILCISDPQEPYSLEDVLPFLRRVRSDFNLQRDHAVHMGDEADFLYGSKFPVDPDNEFSAVGELKWCRERMKPWYAEFPKMRVCISNHTDRWYKKAAGAMIPSQLVRARREILEAPQEWVWADHWDFRDGAMPWRAEHGHNGATNTRQRAVENGISTAHGHFHAKAGAEWAHTAGGQLVWGLATGCLIDAEAIAFKYNKRDRFRPIIGCGVVLDGGRKPLFVPYDR